MTDAPAITVTAKAPLFFQRRFLPMWTALCFGAFTDNMLKQALSIALVYSIISAPLISNDDALPIVGSLFPIAMLAFSTIAGQIADKYETSLMFRRTKLVELFLMIIAALGFLAGSSIILIAALFMMGAQSAFFSPVRTGAMPKYLRANELVRGNAYCSGGLFVFVMIGIVVGGVLITRPNGPVIVSVILIVAALAGWLAIRLAPPAAANAPDIDIDWNAIAQAKKLFGFALAAQGVFRPVIGVAWYWSVGAFVTVAAPLFVRDTLHSDPTVFAVFMSLFTLGAAIGAGLASTLSKRRSGLGFSAAGAGGAAIMSFAVFFLSATYLPDRSAALQNAGEFFSGWRAFALALAFIAASMAMSVYAVPLQAAVQRRAPADRRSRILAANNMINAAGAMVGSWLVLAITRTTLGPAYVFLALGLAQIVVTAYMAYRKNTVREGLYDEILGDGNAPAKPEI